jgi:hypothetical protein
MAMVTGTPTGFAPALLAGLADMGSVDPSSGDLSLELGVSVWLRRSGSSLEHARSVLLDVRTAVLESCGMDTGSEPVPLVGRSLRQDVLTLVAYLGDLLERAAHTACCGRAEVARRAVAALPPLEDVALGA